MLMADEGGADDEGAAAVTTSTLPKKKPLGPYQMDRWGRCGRGRRSLLAMISDGDSGQWTVDSAIGIICLFQ